MSTSPVQLSTAAGSAAALPPAAPINLVPPVADRVPTPPPQEQQAADPAAAFARMHLFSAEDRKDFAEDLSGVLEGPHSPLRGNFEEDDSDIEEAPAAAASAAAAPLSLSVGALPPRLDTAAPEEDEEEFFRAPTLTRTVSSERVGAGAAAAAPAAVLEAHQEEDPFASDGDDEAPAVAAPATSPASRAAEKAKED